MIEIYLERFCKFKKKSPRAPRSILCRHAVTFPAEPITAWVSAFRAKNLAETKRYKLCGRRHEKLLVTNPKREKPFPVTHVAAWRQNGQFSEGWEEEKR